MVALGLACLIAGLLAFAYGACAALWGARRRERAWVDSARRSVYAAAVLLTVCVVVLEAAFLRSDFSVELVADHSSTTTPTLYKMTAMWGSQGGSLLLWAFVLSVASSAVLFATRNRHREVVPYATAVLCGLGVFFCGLMLLADGANPFARLDPAPAEGAGLNPLLRHPAMAVHPPMLYSGYVLFSIPFAFAIGALITRRLDASWIRSTRRFALLAWIFLSIGILLGARWSYSELGWGGYWAWDPVENASLMPWLTGVAFLHSIMVQERRGMLKTWNVSLIAGTFALCLIGTFLVRSGVLESIHAFGASTVGAPLLALVAVVLLGSSVLIVSRQDSLRSERRIESRASREAVFLINNLLLVGLALVIFWGTFFPLISEALTGTRSSLAGPWFGDYTTPLALLLVAFMGIGPLLAWRRISASAAVRVLAWPVGVATVAAVALLLFTDAADSLPAYLLFVAAAFALTGLVQEFARSAAAQRALGGGSYLGALGRVVARNRRRYGGYITHAGLLLLLAGVAASSSFQTSRDVRATPGDSVRVGDYTVTYLEPTADIDGGEQRLAFGARLEVERDGKSLGVLHPTRNYYAGRGDPTAGPVRAFFEGEATSEVAKRENAKEDLWIAMQPDLEPLDPVIAAVDRRLREAMPEIGPGGPTPKQIEQMRRYADAQGDAIERLAALYVVNPLPVNLRINVNPFVIWLWVGGIVAVIGGLIAVWPAPAARRRRVADVYAARLAKELGRA